MIFARISICRNPPLSTVRPRNPAMRCRFASSMQTCLTFWGESVVQGKRGILSSIFGAVRSKEEPGKKSVDCLPFGRWDEHQHPHIILTNIFTNILILTNMVITASIVASSLPPSKDEHRRSQPLLENLDCTGNLKRSADSVDSVVTFVTTSTLLSYKFSTNLGRCRSPMSRQPWESHPGLHRLAAKRFLVQLRISFQLNCLSPGGRCVHQPECKLLLQRRG